MERDRKTEAEKPDEVIRREILANFAAQQN
jgi:hypothetical protein